MIRKFLRLNKLDLAVGLIICLCALGFLTARAGHAGVDSIIEGNGKVAIDVFFAGLKTEDLDIFKVGDKAAITIRNQPIQPPMTISKVQHNPKQTAFLSNDGKKVLTFADPTNPLANDYLITVIDDAEITKDGYVVRGNKIKVGNQVELEGFKYRFQGMVVDITPAH